VLKNFSETPSIKCQENPLTGSQVVYMQAERDIAKLLGAGFEVLKAASMEEFLACGLLIVLMMEAASTS
jgi:hypothetical protein